MYLTPTELEELTGYKHKTKQAEQLRDQRISFVVDRYGHPKVTWSAVESIGGKREKSRRIEPNRQMFNRV